VLTAENLLPEHAAHDWFVQRYRDTRSALCRAFRAGRSAVRSGGRGPGGVAMRLIALLDGLQTQWLLDPEQVDLAAALKDAASALHDELLPRPDGRRGPGSSGPITGVDKRD
jgi:hypothetical protein